MANFITQSKQAGLQKLVIDLQQNSGGQTFLAIDTFKRFFPDVQPFLGSRARASQFLNLTGKQLADYWQSLALNAPEYYELSIDEFVALPRINALTGQNFSSWEEFYGPNNVNGDLYTTPQQYNLSSLIFDVEARGGNVQTAIFGYANNPATYPDPPWAAQDIILLTDGQCASSCALFVEMMTHDAGVRTVVAGGLPMMGPMQAVGLSRGAALESTDDLDDDIVFAQQLDPVATAALPNRTTDFWVQAGAVNLRDQVRPNETEALQFKYLAADCRIFYTRDNFYNFSRLWRDAADAIWTDPFKCVAGSTGFAQTAQLPPPIPEALLRTGESDAEALAGVQFVPLDLNTQASAALEDAGGPGSTRLARSAKNGTRIRRCNSAESHPCPGGYACPPKDEKEKKRGFWTGTCPAVRRTIHTLHRPCPDCRKKTR